MSKHLVLLRYPNPSNYQVPIPIVIIEFSAAQALPASFKTSTFWRGVWAASLENSGWVFAVACQLAFLLWRLRGDQIWDIIGRLVCSFLGVGYAVLCLYCRLQF